MTNVIWPGGFNGRDEKNNFYWVSGIKVTKASNVVLQGNVVAGSERAGET